MQFVCMHSTRLRYWKSLRVPFRTISIGHWWTCPTYWLCAHVLARTASKRCCIYWWKKRSRIPKKNFQLKLHKIFQLQPSHICRSSLHLTSQCKSSTNSISWAIQLMTSVKVNFAEIQHTASQKIHKNNRVPSNVPFQGTKVKSSRASCTSLAFACQMGTHTDWLMCSRLGSHLTADS